MTSQKNTPKSKSLKDQLAPIKAQMKQETSEKAQGKKGAPRPVEVPKSAAKAARTESNTARPDVTSDAETAEFWRAAAGAVPISEGGRELHTPKKAAQQSDAPEQRPSTLDQETFQDLLDLSESTMKSALFEKEGVAAPQRAISSKRVELMGLSEAGARERLQRFLKAAKKRGERVVLVVFGPDFLLRAAVEDALERARGALVLHVSDAGEPQAFKVTLA